MALTIPPSADGYFDFGSCQIIMANVANFFSPSKPSTKWQRKWKTTVPHFADDEPSLTESDKAPKLTRDEKAYSDLFLKSPDSSKRTRVVYVSNEHLDCLKEMARFLKDEYGTGVTISGVVWNLLEHHFNTYGKTIGSLIDKNRPQMPGRFK